MLSIKNLSKSFAGVRALDNVRLDVGRGEVHALMGENGAGKSTLMRVLMGLETPDAGEVQLDGERLKPGSVGEAQKRGIAMIHQELLLVPALTVAQNIYLGREPRRWGLVDEGRLRQQAGELLAQMNVPIPPDAPLQSLTIADRQMVEIAKAISNAARIIIMDEPTSALSETEVATLFRLIRDLTSRGVAIIYISHRMEEIFAIADRVTILRDGQYVATYPTASVDEPTLIQQMVGRNIDSLFPPATAQPGDEVLSVAGLTRTGTFADIGFSIRAGEVLGLAGLMGAGRTEVARAIFGLDPADGGELRLHGQPVRIASPQDAIRNGIGYVSEDRKAWGFIPRLSVRHNLTLTSLRQHAPAGYVRERSEAAAATSIMADLRIKAAGPQQPVMELSGGNQQKVVLGKVLLAAPALVILDEPTRGIDIGAKADIYQLIRQLTERGIAILLISSELPELLGLSDRIVVLAQGRQTATLPRAEATQERIMHFAMPL